MAAKPKPAPPKPPKAEETEGDGENKTGSEEGPKGDEEEFRDGDQQKTQGGDGEQGKDEGKQEDLWLDTEAGHDDTGFQVDGDAFLQFWWYPSCALEYTGRSHQ